MGNRDETLTPPPGESQATTALDSRRVLELLERHEDLDRKILAGVERLVELEERRDQREEAALLAEQRRLEASQEAEHDRLKAELAEQAARGSWFREVAGKAVVPLVTAVVAILTALAGALTAWASGAFGVDR